MKLIIPGILLFVFGLQVFAADLSSVIPMISPIETADADQYWIAHPEILPGVGLSVINRRNGKRVTAIAVRASRIDPLGRVLISRGLAAVLDVQEGQETRLGIESLTRGGNPGLPSEIPFQDPDVDMSLLAGRYIIPPAGRKQATIQVPSPEYQSGLFSSSIKQTPGAGSTGNLARPTLTAGTSGSFYVVEAGPSRSGGMEGQKQVSTRTTNTNPDLFAAPASPGLNSGSAPHVSSLPSLPAVPASGIEKEYLPFLQIGIFNGQSGMKHMVEYFMKYFPVEIRSVKTGGKLFYKLLLGPLYGSTRTNARNRVMEYGVKDAFFTE